MSECLVEAFRHGYEYAISSLLRIRDLVVKVLDESIAILAAKIGAERTLHLADSIILATAEYHGLPLWTLDRRLANKSPNIRYLLSE